MIMRRPNWTTDEDAVLREHYQRKGSQWCADRLPGRDWRHVQARAKRLAITKCRADLTIPSTEFIDAAIRRGYQGERAIGFVERTAKQVGRSRAWVQRRASLLGLAPSRRGFRPWSKGETDLAEAHPLATPHVLSRLLKEHGYSRTPKAIESRRRDGDLERGNTEWFSASALAQALGVNVGTVLKWINNGWLMADVRWVSQAQKSSGSRFAIHETCVARFIVEHPSQVSLSKIEPNKVWFIDLMARCAAPSTGAERDLGKRIVALAEARPDLSYTQIADMLGSQPGSVKVTLSKARRARREANAA